MWRSHEIRKEAHSNPVARNGDKRTNLEKIYRDATPARRGSGGNAVTVQTDEEFGLALTDIELFDEPARTGTVTHEADGLAVWLVVERLVLDSFLALAEVLLAELQATQPLIRAGRRGDQRGQALLGQGQLLFEIGLCQRQFRNASRQARTMPGQPQYNEGQDTEHQL